MTIEIMNIFRKRHHAIAFTCVAENIDYWLVTCSEPVKDNPKALALTAAKTGYTVRRFGWRGGKHYMYVQGEAA